MPSSPSIAPVAVARLGGWLRTASSAYDFRGACIGRTSPSIRRRDPFPSGWKARGVRRSQSRAPWPVVVLVVVVVVVVAFHSWFAAAAVAAAAAAAAARDSSSALDRARRSFILRHG